jgi:hypothetical protein
MRKPRPVPPLCGLLLLAALAGCTTGPTAEAALEGHEGVHGPPWALNETPWVAPPVYAGDLSPYWYDGYYGYYGPAWYGSGLALGFGFGRPHFRHGGWVGPGFPHGFHGGWRGGGFRGGGFHSGHHGGGRGRH